MYVNLVITKAGVKHELLLNKLASEVSLLSKSSSLAPGLDVAQFITVNIRPLFDVLLKSDLRPT